MKFTFLTSLIVIALAPPAAHAQAVGQLIAGAKNEGKLVIYASAAARQLPMYLAAFGKRYPFIKTEYFRTDKQKLVTRGLLEEQAKQRLADVIHTSVIETPILKKRGAQNADVMAGNTNLLNLLTAGEFTIMAGVYELPRSKLRGSSFL